MANGCVGGSLPGHLCVDRWFPTWERELYILFIPGLVVTLFLAPLVGSIDRLMNQPMKHAVPERTGSGISVSPKRVKLD